MKSTASISLVIFRASLIAGVITTILASFISYKTLDRNVPYGSESFLAVGEISEELSDSQASRILDEAASAYKLNLYRVVQNADFSVSDRTVYAFIGDRTLWEALYPEGSYPSFDKTSSTSLRPGAELDNSELIGAYSVSSNDDDTAALIVYLRAMGISVSSEAISPTRAVFETLTFSPFAPVAWGTFIMLGLSTVYFVSQRQRLLKIKLVHGHSWLRGSISELIETVGYFLIVVGLSAPLTFSALAAYNGLNQFSSFIAQTATALGIILVVVIILQSAALALLPECTEVESIKGNYAKRTVAAVVSVAQFAILALTISTLSQFSLQYEGARQNSEMLENWAAVDGYVGVAFNAKNDEDYRLIGTKFGSVITRLESDNEVLLSYRPEQSRQDESRLGPDSGNALIANQEFLNRNAIHLLDGRPYTLPDVETADLILLIPEQYSERLDEIETQYRTWAEFQSSLLPSAIAPRTLSIEIELTRPDQRLFNYEYFTPGSPMWQVDPVVGVVPPGNAWLSGDFYAAVASQGGLLFKDATSFSEEMDEVGLPESTQALVAAGARATNGVNQELNDAYERVPAGLFLVILLFFSAVLSGAVYGDKNRTRNFIKRVHGHSFARTHFAFLATTILTGAVAVMLATAAAEVQLGQTLAFGLFCLGVSCAGAVGGIVLRIRRFRLT